MLCGCLPMGARMQTLERRSHYICSVDGWYGLHKIKTKKGEMKVNPIEVGLQTQKHDKKRHQNQDHKNHHSEKSTSHQKVNFSVCILSPAH